MSPDIDPEVPTALSERRQRTLFYVTRGVWLLLVHSRPTAIACDTLMSHLAQGTAGQIPGWRTAERLGMDRAPDMWVAEPDEERCPELWATLDRHEPARQSAACPCTRRGIKHDGPQAIVTIQLPEEY